ncbi:MAG: DUF1801 domain-containing protein [Bauldia sp.]
MTAEVDAFVESNILPDYRQAARKLVALMRDAVPHAWEGISYGIPMWKLTRGIAVLNASKGGLTFAFSRGAYFEDRYGLLEGVGKVSKNVRLKSVADFNEPALRYYIAQAIEHDRR